MDFFSLMFIIITYSFTNVSGKIIIDTINTNISWLYLTKFYFHPIYGQIDISLYSLENTIRFFALNKQEWIEIKNDLSNICLKNELKLNQTKNETNLWSLSSSFTSIGQMHFILSKCNSSLNTTFIDQVFANENILLICNYIQMILYLLTCFWFIICLICTSKPPTKTHRSFLIFSIWFITNAIVVLLNILDVLPNLQITILTAVTISIHFLAYYIFLFIIQTKTFLLRTKLNQINIAYIDPTLSKTHLQDLLTREKAVTTTSCELTDLYSIGNANKSKLRMPLKSLETFRRLEPRRDVLLNPSLQSYIVSIQSSANPLPRRLSPLKRDD
ncbi:unnamed protein product [Rotaria magnacalcarata]|uniref:Uncharacterized protein n=1 Tax=Rotaria magnacalcarata TaxID=392030 RepID=A0A816QHT5_9BILA|nr:unnamed protein product [Rotaria magnacalcarata]